MTRSTVPAKVRFEVFKRDSFTCQYCGKRAPDVVLHLEHIEPASLGGSDDLLNLVTACERCNLGKGPMPLSDQAVLEKQRAQLDRLQERHEQFTMMLRWKDGLLQQSEDLCEEVAGYLTRQTPGLGLSPYGHAELHKLLRKHPLDQVLYAIDAAIAQYVEFDAQGKATTRSFAEAFTKIGRIITMRRADIAKPYLKDLFYVRKIVENRCHYFDGARALDCLRRCSAPAQTRTN